jgi:hypothetical protein
MHFLKCAIPQETLLQVIVARTSGHIFRERRFFDNAPMNANLRTERQIHMKSQELRLSQERAF